MIGKEVKQISRNPTPAGSLPSTKCHDILKKRRKAFERKHHVPLDP